MITCHLDSEMIGVYACQALHRLTITTVQNPPLEFMHTSITLPASGVANSGALFIGYYIITSLAQMNIHHGLHLVFPSPWSHKKIILSSTVIAKISHVPEYIIAK